MIKMSSSHNAEEILDICIESIGGNDIKSNFRLLRDQIISHYDQYEIAAANLSFSKSVSGSICGIGIGLLNSSTATKV